MSRVAEIARLTREASDDLYTSYQALVKLLDEQCRPLLYAGTIFTDMSWRAERIINFRKYREEAERKQREIIEKRQSKGLCRHCGGTFRKVFLGYKCESCGRRKDY